MAKDIQEIKFNQSLGALIRRRRKCLGMSQTVAAKLTGVTFQQFQKYEAGANTISSYRLHRISAALQTSFASHISGGFTEFNCRALNADKIKSLLSALERKLSQYI